MGDATEHRTIRCEVDPPLLRIRLCRPEVLNAIDGRMLVELRDALDRAARDPAIRVVLVDSACDRAFCAGIDVGWVRGLRGLEVREVGRELHRTFLALRTTEKPIVAAIDGFCLGAGLELAVSCDFMLATGRSRFGLPNIHRGIPAIVEAAILPAAIGLQGAREMAYTGELWDAAKAERRGLLHAVVEPAELAAEAARWCARLARSSSTALALQKEILHKWMTTDLETAIDFSINTVVLSFGEPDQEEAMRSFVEKRRDR
jgi:enoyl-CoA hydratase/carnithine racemase